MIIRPKLPVELLGGGPPELERAAVVENITISAADWSGQAHARVTFDTVRMVDVSLTAASLRESVWSDAELSGGELGGLDLTGAALRRVAILKARLSGLIVVEARLTDVTVSRAKLNLANFRVSKLNRVHFSGCDLREADFAGASLTDVKFDDCDLAGASFHDAKLKNVDLRGSQLQSIDGIAGLGGATISHAQLIGLAPELAAGIGLKVSDD